MGGGDVDWDQLRPMLQALTERLDYVERHLQDVAARDGHHYATFASTIDAGTTGGGVPPDIAELARSGKTIEAIKRYRALTGASLHQAQEAVARAAATGA